MVQTDEYLSLMQATQVKGVTRAVLYRAMKRGALAYSVIGERRVIRKEDLDSFIPHAYSGKKPTSTAPTPKEASVRHPLEGAIGSFRDDPLWDDMMEAIKEAEASQSQIDEANDAK